MLVNDYLGRVGFAEDGLLFLELEWDLLLFMLRLGDLSFLKSIFTLELQI